MRNIFFAVRDADTSFFFPSIGTADWHHLRKFSFTSSQAYFAFVKAFHLFKNDESWIEVAKFIWGERDWRSALDLGPADNDEDDATDEDEDEERVKIDEYFQNFILSDEDHSSEAAFHFVQPFVANDTRTEADEARDLASGLNLPVLSAVVKILSDRVAQQQRKRPSTKKSMQKEIEKWLTLANAEREFMFLSTQTLKDMILKRGIKIKGSKTIDSMIKALALFESGEVSQANVEAAAIANLNPEQAAMRAILERSFLPHQKGEQREDCSMGHILERPILERWIAQIPKRGFPARSLRVGGAYTAGLVAKKDAAWVKDSIDFVLTTLHNNRDLVHQDLWGIEVKARVNPNTAAAEEEFVSSASREKNIRINSVDVHKNIKNVGERFQILHHAQAYNLHTIVIIVGDSQSEIIQSTIVDFNCELNRHYEKVLEQMKDLVLGWAYTSDDISLPIKLPPEILEVAKTLPTIHDDEAVEGTANLWLSLQSNPLPMPSFVRLIPAVCAYWNAVKSDSDTTTKLMDDRVLYPPHINLETIVTTRLLHLANVIIHRLIQMITAKPNLESYPSLAHYRNASSHRSTFHNTLLQISSTLKKELVEQQKKKDALVSEEVESQVARQSQTRSLPCRQRVLGVIPQEMEFGVKLPFCTPKKIKQKVEKKEVSESICNMYEKCTGRLVQLVDSKKKQRCTLCKATTTYYCAGCKSWFCFTKRVTSNSKNQKPLDLVHYNIKGEREVFFSSCFSKKHQDAWAREDEMTSAAITPEKSKCFVSPEQQWYKHG